MREQARKLRKKMRCSDLLRKPVEISRNEISPRERSNKGYRIPWQAGGKAKFIYLPPGYNNDPCMLRHTAGCSFKGETSFKSSLIDLEAWDYAIAA